MAYAIIDTATTGLDERTSRILELAIIVTDESLNETDRFESVIDPECEDLGLTTMHRLKHEDVQGAPTFGELAPTIAGLLDGTVLVAHNLEFHARFVCHELRQAQIEHVRGTGLCTLNLAVANGWPLKRPETARHLGVEDSGPAFSSIRDAVRCLGIARHAKNLGGLEPFAAAIRHDGLPVEVKLRSRTAPEPVERSRRDGLSEAQLAYWDRLHEYLGPDGDLDGGERADLLSLGLSLGLEQTSIRATETAYVKHLIDRARIAATELGFSDQPDEPR